ncbi:hypothetical protein chiPu_0017343 [Chiloscyllium punctatum]|uniref:Uncharacterized protein n=1 Tax=Chiloscyllium punctatum TaxID=137246 RepID=A0A401RF47_CHIPU|nr:hypothetical protein [Chiloscyllium punctatum]
MLIVFRIPPRFRITAFNSLVFFLNQSNEEVRLWFASGGKGDSSPNLPTRFTPIIVRHSTGGRHFGKSGRQAFQHGEL